MGTGVDRYAEEAAPETRPIFNTHILHPPVFAIQYGMGQGTEGTRTHPGWG